MQLPVDLQLPGAAMPVELRAGLSTIIVGANGSGKTRLAIQCEDQLGAQSHRISAQRMLAIDPAIEKVSEQSARNLLQAGAANLSDYGGRDNARRAARWNNGGPRAILNDAGALLQVLFAEQANTAVKVYNAEADGSPIDLEQTLFRKLKAVWERVLPTRQLQITADDIFITASVNEVSSDPYSVTGLSDGEKAVFYMIGQVLVADQGSVFIMDEPEIHVHRSILSRLWDELEAARSDCAFLLITHDLEFAASRAGKKYVVRSYAPATGWVIEGVPEAEGFREDLVTLILGSRKPVLFVEGKQGSLDLAFYRACFPDRTVIPRGGCEQVIHAVSTMRHNAAFTTIAATGMVDADGRIDEDREYLATLDIQVLPVAEIENLLLLPSVSQVILELNELTAAEVDAKLAGLKTAVFADASNPKNVNEVVLGYCRRRIDRTLKRIDFKAAKSVDDLADVYREQTGEVDVAALAAEMEAKIAEAIAVDDLAKLLAVYDRKKPLLALAASHLRNWNVEVFSAWVTRAIQSKRDDRLRLAIEAVLPTVA